MNWNRKRVLVTGGAGQIGSHLVARLASYGAIVTVADNLWRGKKRICSIREADQSWTSTEISWNWI